MIRQEDVFKIGQFTKPHGTKGEIGLVTQCDVFDDTDDPYLVCEMNGILVPFFIEEYRYKTDSVILVKMERIDSEDVARQFINKEVFYPLEAMPEEEDLIGNITWDSFIGYQVTDEQAGVLGSITGVDESTRNILFKVNYKGNELLIPAVEEIIVSADHAAKEVTVRLPEGLLDL
ncbi:MAG: ribosome maturation factor RimM [Tannerellaceae bacterium]|nr:ribosome maturation factor RimM [Tannerellaceae bacterium]